MDLKTSQFFVTFCGVHCHHNLLAITVLLGDVGSLVLLGESVFEATWGWAAASCSNHFIGRTVASTIEMDAHPLGKCFSDEVALLDGQTMSLSLSSWVDGGGLFHVDGPGLTSGASTYSKQ